MSHLLPSNGRRFLNFPAINPCLGVSPVALLADLSSIAAKIVSFGRRESENFRAQRRTARSALRIVALVIVFLDDLRLVSRSSFSRSSILCLSELHVTLQKLLLLLADCSRGGASLWTLLNADRIDGEFVALLRSIAIALEVFPLDSMDISFEIKAVVDLITDQARRIVIGVDRAANLSIRSVRSIFVQFQEGESPDLDDLWRVLSYLEITSWIDCFAEISFLEDEIMAEENGGEVSLLWSSLGFMVYSLVLFFDPPPNGKGKKMEECFRYIESIANVKNLSAGDFHCPISLDLMKDPVTISTGQTYDRRSILRWLKSGNQTCPITGEKLTRPELIPNSTILHLISLYSRENGILIAKRDNSPKRDLSKTVFPASQTAIGAIRMAAINVVGKLTGGESEKNMAAYEIRVLSKSNIFIRLCFVEAGAIKYLLNLLSSSSDPSLQDNAIAALLNLSKHHNGRANIFESSGLSSIIQAMKIGHKIETQQNAAAILFYLCAMEECREAIGELPEAIPSLVELLKNGTHRGKKNAILAIYGLLLFPGNHAKILSADTIPAIADLLETEEEEEDEIVSDCVGVLAKISELPEGTKEILKSRVFSSLVHVLCSSSSSSGREHCVSALLSICKNGGEKALSLMEKTPLLMPSLYSLLSDSSRHASKKARLLLNYIHSFSDQDRDMFGCFLTEIWALQLRNAKVLSLDLSPQWKVSYAYAALFAFLHFRRRLGGAGGLARWRRRPGEAGQRATRPFSANSRGDAHVLARAKMDRRSWLLVRASRIRRM